MYDFNLGNNTMSVLNGRNSEIYEQIGRHPEWISEITEEELVRKCIDKNPQAVKYLNEKFRNPPFLISLVSHEPRVFSFFEEKYKLNKAFVLKCIETNPSVVGVFYGLMLYSYDLLKACIELYNESLFNLFDYINPPLRRQLIEDVKIDYSRYIEKLTMTTMFLVTYISPEKLEENADAILRLCNANIGVLLLLPTSFLHRHFKKIASGHSTLESYLSKMLYLPYELRPLWIDEAIRVYGMQPILSRAQIESRLTTYKSCLKSVTIFINAHGKDVATELPPDLPWNTAVSISVGLLNISLVHDNIFEATRNHEMIQSVYKGNNIKNANLILSELDYGYLNDYVYQLGHPDIDLEIKACPHLKTRYEMKRNEHNYLRSFTQDRLYAVESKDKRQYFQGIYVIHTTNPEMMPSFTGKLPKVDIVNNFIPDFKSLEEYQSLQERNLFNVEVAMNIESQKILNVDRCFVKGATVTTPRGVGYIKDITSPKQTEQEKSGIEGIELQELFPILEYTVRIQDADYTYTKEQLSRPTIKEGNGLDRLHIELNGLKKYKVVRMSSILAYFQRLGFDHVNLIDNACRNTELTPGAQRHRSMAETKRYLDFGGKKTIKRKKKTKMILRSKKLKRM